MSSRRLKGANDETRYSWSQLVQLRKQMLRFARSIPPGADRNERRQIARSLHNLLHNSDRHSVRLNIRLVASTDLDTRVDTL